MYYLTVLQVRNPTHVSLGWNEAVGRAVFPSGVFRGESVSLPLPASRGHTPSLVHSSFFHLQSQQCWGFPGGAVVRIRLPMQGTRVRALVREDPMCRGATKPMHHNYWACGPQLLSPWATTTEACAPRARAPQQEKPPQWEAHAPQQRVAPARRN